MNRIAVALKAIAAVVWILPAEKSVEYFDATLTRMVRNVYNGNLGGDFIDILANLIQGQFNKAFDEAAKQNDVELEDIDPAWRTQLDDKIAQQFDFVDKFYRDIIDARIDKTPIDPLLARVPLWAQHYTDILTWANTLMADKKQRKVWRLGATEEHCEICAALNGIVAYAHEWDELNVYPKNAPNPALEKENGGCGGWRCDCSLEDTDQKRDHQAKDRIREITKI